MGKVEQMSGIGKYREVMHDTYEVRIGLEIQARNNAEYVRSAFIRISSITR